MWMDALDAHEFQNVIQVYNRLALPVCVISVTSVHSLLTR